MYISSENKQTGEHVALLKSTVRVTAAGHFSEQNRLGIKNDEKSQTLIYLEKGSGEIRCENQSVGIEAGDVMLLPSAPLLDVVLSDQGSSHIYWVKFMGISPQECQDISSLEPLTPAHCPNAYIPESVKSIILELNKNQSFSSEIASAKLIGMLLLTAQQLSVEAETASIREIIQFIQNNYMYNTPIGDYAKRCGMSVPNFIRLFKRASGMSPHDYKLSIRIERAKIMLATTDSSVTDISIQIGFNDQFQFSRYFKKKTGMSPMSYRSSSKQSPQ